MRPPRAKNHYIREWRKRRGISLRKLADRMEIEPGIPIISHAQIARIESGENDYTQTTLEALAEALGVDKSVLLSVNPEKDGEVVDLLKIIPEEKREDAVRILRALAS